MSERMCMVQQHKPKQQPKARMMCQRGETEKLNPRGVLKVHLQVNEELDFAAFCQHSVRLHDTQEN